MKRFNQGLGNFKWQLYVCNSITIGLQNAMVLEVKFVSLVKFKVNQYIVYFYLNYAIQYNNFNFIPCIIFTDLNLLPHGDLTYFLFLGSSINFDNTNNQDRMYVNQTTQFIQYT